MAFITIPSPKSFLRIGLKGRLEKKDLIIIGRVAYRATIKEWDPEDQQYYEEIWNYDEWYLKDRQGKIYFLQEDEEGFTFGEQIKVSNPVFPESNVDTMTLFKDKPAQRILERGLVNIQGFEGTLEWQPHQDILSYYAEYKDGAYIYSVEKEVDKTNEEVDELTFYKEKTIDRKELAKAFNVAGGVFVDNGVKTGQFVSVNGRRRSKINSGEILMMVVCVLLAVVAIAIPTYGNMKKNTLLAQKFAANQIDEQPVIVGPIKLNKVDSVHQIQLRASFPDNSAFYVEAELLNDQKQPINLIVGDFWRESGRDSEGSWSEDKTYESLYFRLESSGDYYLAVSFDPPVFPKSTTIGVTVFENVWLTRYYIPTAIIALIMAYIFYWRSGIKNKFSLVELVEI